MLLYKSPSIITVSFLVRRLFISSSYMIKHTYIHMFAIFFSLRFSSSKLFFFSRVFSQGNYHSEHSIRCLIESPTCMFYRRLFQFMPYYMHTHVSMLYFLSIFDSHSCILYLHGVVVYHFHIHFAFSLYQSPSRAISVSLSLSLVLYSSNILCNLPEMKAENPRVHENTLFAM